MHIANMDDELRSEVTAALQQYCETVSEHNLLSLRTLVETMEAQPLPPHCSASVAETLHMQELRRLLQGAVPEGVRSPRDLLKDEFRAELIKRASLDGLSHFPVNNELREEYFAVIRSHVEEQNVQAAEFPPPDLQYLCMLTSGVTGPGLPHHRESQQFDFVSPIEDNQIEEMSEYVVVPLRDDEEGGYNELTDLWEDWDITVAVKIGGGPQWGGSWVLYCRNEDNDQWAWRYGVHDEDWCSELHDSMTSFLGFYAHFKEQTEDEVKRSVRDLKGLL
jgi:hypothetical protein